jgi:hypothetical protein
MANKVLLKKSSVVARVPTISDLDYGELAINYADGKLYFKTSSNNINYFSSADQIANDSLFQVVARDATVSTKLSGLLQTYLDYDSFTTRSTLATVGTRSGDALIQG